MLKTAELKCCNCSIINRIRMYDCTWKFELDGDLGNSPSSLYDKSCDLINLLQINDLLGEQNMILKKENSSLKQFIKNNIRCDKAPE